MTVSAPLVLNNVLERFPIIRDIFRQRRIVFEMRPIDMTWHYKNIVPISAAGFNPFGNKVYYGRNSFIQKAFRGGAITSPAEIDWCLYEIFFAAHDYVHIWAVSEALGWFPHCEGPKAWDHPQNVSDLYFILLLSEAAATAAIDYWMLSNCDISRELGLPTKFRGLTTSYRAEQLQQTRLFSDASFEIMSKDFFNWLSEVYCSGTISRFCDFQKAADELAWLRKEDRISKKQRKQASEWLSYLSGRSLAPEYFALNEGDRELRARVVRQVASGLWKVCSGEAFFSRANFAPGRRVPMPEATKNIDFRYNDISSISFSDLGLILPSCSVEQIGYFAAQYISHFDWSDDVNISDEWFDEVVRKRDWSRMLDTFGPLPDAASPDRHRRHVFFPN